MLQTVVLFHELRDGPLQHDCCSNITFHVGSSLGVGHGQLLQTAKDIIEFRGKLAMLKPSGLHLLLQLVPRRPYLVVRLCTHASMLLAGAFQVVRRPTGLAFALTIHIIHGLDRD